MTIILATLEAMASDRQIVIGTAKQRGPKLFAHDRRIYGGCGDAALTELWRALIVDGGNPQEAWPADADLDDFEGLELGSDGIFWWSRWFARTVLDDPFMGIGTGRDYGVAALALGFDIQRGVELACEHDANCGGGVQIITLKSLDASHVSSAQCP